MSDRSAELPSRKSLVLVIGAGASYEAKLPLGAELKKEIADLLDIRYDHRRISGDNLIDQAFHLLVRDDSGRRGDINPFLHASWRIRDAMPQAISIDHFVDAHRSDPLIAKCGKLGIARSILLAESKSSLVIDPGNIHNRLNFQALERIWYNAFFQILTENCQQADLWKRFSQIAVVCFNYDRCIQHYLVNALQNYYGMSAEEAATALTELEFHHPYGMVGNLPWTRTGDTIAFGANPSAQQLIALADQIKTFTEGSNERTSDIARVREVLGSADRIAFLGFAFHRLNVELLFPPQEGGVPTKQCSVFATGVGISAPDARVINEELLQLGGINPNSTYIARDITCAKLFAEFRRSLSFK
jgi:hypothetical protein